ncbi:group-specific protein [Brevibacillus laterosporus]|uniref:group-specific protein n=1 Tax=Brevibacillus laterosporus TaxID=1465 RepID=UPI000C774438|nr:group-specific protein [Brevibacillus laterosporus]AUM65500.1 group-specific protein [Brevibacillus laterosporus]
MGECKLDHSQADVLQKWADQQTYLPKALAEQIHVFLQKELPQSTLNELFHALKKYDWAEESEREARNKKLLDLISLP